MSVARLGPLLFGEDRQHSAAGVAAAVALVVVVLADVALEIGLVDSLPQPLVYLGVSGAVLAAAFAYVNEGVLVAVCLGVAPVYALWVEILHQGMISPAPYPQAAVEALLFGLFGVPGGLLGAVLGLAARRVLD